MESAEISAWFSARTAGASAAARAMERAIRRIKLRKQMGPHARKQASGPGKNRTGIAV
jgi:hypothetical protein